MIDGDVTRINQCASNFTSLNWGLSILPLRVTQETVLELQRLVLHKDPDVFSLDIDGLDYYVAREFFAAKIRPKIVVVEYNSALGPTASLTVAYKSDFDIRREHHSQMYFGVSLTGWRRFFLDLGYLFVTVEQNGCNAFFVDPSQFKPGFLDGIKGLDFCENFALFRQHGFGWEGQFEILRECKFTVI